MEYDHDENTDGDEITVWGMKQEGKMLPGYDNPHWNGDDCDEDELWKNRYCDLDQNWTRSELSNLENAKYKPSKDKTSEVHTSVSVSTGDVGVSASIDHPKVDRNMTYKSDEGLYGNYDFKIGDNYYDGAWKNCAFGQVTTWTSDRPEDSGDNIAPTWMYGKFEGYSCPDDGGGRDYEDQHDTSLFEMFEWEDF
jgi:hypothetical protein